MGAIGLKKLFSEFKTFISKGSVIDLAVGVIIGAAFKTIVDSLVGDVISPLIGLVGNTDLSNLAWQVGGVSIGYGAFLTAVLNFLIMAVVLFLLIKGINATRALGGKIKKDAPEKPAEPTEKVCPFCRMKIPLEATRCPYCTSEVTE